MDTIFVYHVFLVARILRALTHRYRALKFSVAFAAQNISALQVQDYQQSICPEGLELLNRTDFSILRQALEVAKNVDLGMLLAAIIHPFDGSRFKY